MPAPEPYGGPLAAVILAAGKGTRMKSDLPKVLHTLAGRPLLSYAVAAAEGLGARRVVIVVGHGADLVEKAMAGPNRRFALQEPQLGTGHALMAAAPELAGWDGPVLILCGDVPGISPATLDALLKSHQRRGDALTVLGMEPKDPGHYGRMITQSGALKAIVEYRDADEAQRAVRLVNAGIYAAQAGPLLDFLPRLSNHNDQGEYYLTDLVGLMNGAGLSVGWSLCPDAAEAAGVNTVEELKELEARMGASGQGD